MNIKSFGNMPLEDYHKVMAEVLEYLIQYEKSPFDNNKEMAQYIQDYLGIEINKCQHCGTILNKDTK